MPGLKVQDVIFYLALLLVSSIVCFSDERSIKFAAPIWKVFNKFMKKVLIYCVTSNILNVSPIRKEVLNVAEDRQTTLKKP